MSDRKVAIPKTSQRAKVPDEVERALSPLAKLTVDAVRDQWRASLRDEPPPCQSRRVLRLLLAWRLQEARMGGLSIAARRRLRQLANAVEPGKTIATPRATLKRGMVLAREWKGVMHRVHVIEDGFAHNGKVYGTLSEAARAITGTRWSGPRFFGVSGSIARAD